MAEPRFARKQTYTPAEALAKYLGTTVEQVERLLDQVQMEEMVSHPAFAEAITQQTVERLRESGVLSDDRPT